MDEQDDDAFNEAAYLRLYPDVAKAVEDGHVRSGWHHYDRHGRAERRKGSDFDAKFYLQAYPVATEEIATGQARTPFEHYNKIGRSRGFLNGPKGHRATNAAAVASIYGGLWPDQANGLDVIQGKLEIGQITERQAEQLRFWIQNGYLVLENAIPTAITDNAVRDLDRAYAGGFSELRFHCEAISRIDIPWQKEITSHPAKALDIHHFSPAIRDLIFAHEIVEFLGLIFESKALVSQTLGFLRGSAQDGHQDSAFVPYTIPRQFAASWIALEDVTLGAGELFYYPGSHLFEDFSYLGQYKSVYEARRMTGDSLQEQIERHIDSLKERAAEQGIKKTPFIAKKGDAFIWHADLVHGGNPVSRKITRKSVVTHYCPKYLLPLYSEHTAIRMQSHGDHRHTSSYYQSDPL